MAHCSTIKLRSSRPNFWKSSGASPGLAGDGAVAADGRGGVASLGMTGGRRVGSTSGGGRKAVRWGWIARWIPRPVKAAKTVTSPPIRASFQDGRMEDSSRGSSGGNAAILTQFRVFVKTSIGDFSGLPSHFLCDLNLPADVPGHR